MAKLNPNSNSLLLWNKIKELKFKLKQFETLLGIRPFNLEDIKGEKGDKGDKGNTGDKGDAFTYSDFTTEEIAELQKPALDASKRVDDKILEANDVIDKANLATTNAIDATNNTNIATQNANEATQLVTQKIDDIEERTAIAIQNTISATNLQEQRVDDKILEVNNAIESTNIATQNANTATQNAHTAADNVTNSLVQLIQPDFFTGKGLGTFDISANQELSPDLSDWFTVIWDKRITNIAVATIVKFQFSNNRYITIDVVGWNSIININGNRILYNDGSTGTTNALFVMMSFNLKTGKVLTYTDGYIKLVEKDIPNFIYDSIIESPIIKVSFFPTADLKISYTGVAILNCKITDKIATEIWREGLYFESFLPTKYKARTNTKNYLNLSSVSVSKSDMTIIESSVNSVTFGSNTPSNNCYLIKSDFITPDVQIYNTYIKADLEILSGSIKVVGFNTNGRCTATIKDVSGNVIPNTTELTVGKYTLEWEGTTDTSSAYLVNFNVITAAKLKLSNLYKMDKGCTIFATTQNTYGNKLRLLNGLMSTEIQAMLEFDIYKPSAVNSIESLPQFTGQIGNTATNIYIGGFKNGVGTWKLISAY